MVLFRVAVPSSMTHRPIPELALMVQLVSVALLARLPGTSDWTSRPAPMPELALRVQLVSVAVPPARLNNSPTSMYRAPPSLLAELPLRVQLVSVTGLPLLT